MQRRLAKTPLRDLGAALHTNSPARLLDVRPVDRQDPVAAMNEVVRQQRGDRTLADTALLVAQDKTLHQRSPFTRGSLTPVAERDARRRRGACPSCRPRWVSR